MTVQHEGVVATLNVFYHCIGAVALGQVGAGGTRVGAVEAQAMGPAIVHGNTIIGGDGRGWSRLDGWCDQRQWFGSGEHGGVSAVEVGFAGCEFVEVFLIFGCEVCDKFGNGFVDCRAICHKSQVNMKTPVDSSRRSVRSMRATSTMGLPPTAAMHWTSRRHSQRDSMGLLGVHRVTMLAQLVSNSAQVMVP